MNIVSLEKKGRKERDIHYIGRGIILDVHSMCDKGQRWTVGVVM